MPQLIGYMTERKRHRERWVGALVNTSTAEIPIRLINGVDDPVSGRHMAARYAQLVHNADIVLLDHIGHYPHVEAPDAVTRAFLEVHANEVLA